MEFLLQYLPQILSSVGGILLGVVGYFLRNYFKKPTYQAEADKLSAEVWEMALTQAKTTAKELIEKVNKQEVQVEALQKEVSELRKKERQYHELKGKYDSLKDDYKTLRKDHDKLKRDYESLNKAYQELEKEVKRVLKENGLDPTDHKIDEIRPELGST